MSLIFTYIYIVNIWPTFHQKMHATAKQGVGGKSELFNFLIAVIKFNKVVISNKKNPNQTNLKHREMKHSNRSVKPRLKQSSNSCPSAAAIAVRTS